MKLTSRQTYKIVRAILTLKRFSQYQISKSENVAFSLVNRVVNWFVSMGFVVKRSGFYELIAPGAVFALFPVYRKLKPFAVFDVDLDNKIFFEMIKGNGVLCLTSALSHYDNYFRDKSIQVYLKDDLIIKQLNGLPKGYTHIELFTEDLNSEDFVNFNGQLATNKFRTIIDLFCYGKAYAAERLIKKEWLQ